MRSATSPPDERRLISAGILAALAVLAVGMRTRRRYASIPLLDPRRSSADRGRPRTPDRAGIIDRDVLGSCDVGMRRKGEDWRGDTQRIVGRIIVHHELLGSLGSPFLAGAPVGFQRLTRLTQTPSRFACEVDREDPDRFVELLVPSGPRPQ